MQLLRAILILCFSYTLVFLPPAHSNEALALSMGDLIAPEIYHDPIAKVFSPDESIIIRTTVTDNNGIKNVYFFYREVNSVEFKSLRLKRELDSDIYSAKLPSVEAPGIEYYLQATDLAENSVFLGQRFSLLTIVVAPAIEVKTPKPKEVAEEKGGISKWVWIGLGALAVGAFASGGDSDNEPPPIGTGTAVITGPAP